MPAREQYDHLCAVHHFVGIAQPFGMGATENGRKANRSDSGNRHTEAAPRTLGGVTVRNDRYVTNGLSSPAGRRSKRRVLERHREAARQPVGLLRRCH